MYKNYFDSGTKMIEKNFTFNFSKNKSEQKPNEKMRPIIIQEIYSPNKIKKILLPGAFNYNNKY